MIRRRVLNVALLVQTPPTRSGFGRSPDGACPLSFCYAQDIIWVLVISPDKMSGFVKKAKKKAGLFVDKLRPGSRQPSPTPPDPTSIPPAPSADRHAYADPQAPQSAGATAGSVIHELLAAARDGSDLCLPLKAALTGVVKIWDVCEVSRALALSVILLTLESAHNANERGIREARKQARAFHCCDESIR